MRPTKKGPLPYSTTTAFLISTVSMLRRAFALYAALREARRQRGSLDFDLPEADSRLDEAGRVVWIGHRQRHDAHRLIEEFMRVLPLSPILRACAVLALGGVSFLALFLPIAWQNAPEALEPVLQRLRRKKRAA